MPWKWRPHSRIMLLFIVIFVFLCTIFLGSYFIVDDRHLYEPIPMKLANVSQCYRQPNTVTAAASASFSDNGVHGDSDSIQYFEDILDSKWKPTPGKSIFFHETSCSKTGIVELNSK